MSVKWTEELIEQHSMERINALFESLMSEKEIQLFNKMVLCQDLRQLKYLFF